MHPRFQDLVREAAAHYEIVILDCPPVLNLSDAIAVGRAATSNFLVVRAGVSSVDDIRFAVGRLTQNRVAVQGLIFNDLSSGGTANRYSTYYARRYAGKA
jgi:tyrosine-protein kinase Etk/Wzc